MLKGLVVFRTFVTMDDTGNICIEATNLSNEDLYMQLRTAVSVLKDAYEEPRVDIVDGTAEEVLVIGKGQDLSELTDRMEIGDTHNSGDQHHFDEETRGSIQPG